MKVTKAALPICDGLSGEHANLRKESAAALGEIANPVAAPFLEAVVDDLDPEVRKNARWALQQIASRNRATS
jgi:HEAT repeat protein